MTHVLCNMQYELMPARPGGPRLLVSSSPEGARVRGFALAGGCLLAAGLAGCEGDTPPARPPVPAPATPRPQPGEGVAAPSSAVRGSKVSPKKRDASRRDLKLSSQDLEGGIAVIDIDADGDLTERDIARIASFTAALIARG